MRRKQKYKRKQTDPSLRQSIVDMYTTERCTEKQISERLDVAPSTVHLWLGRYYAHRDLTNLAKSGRPRKLDPETDRAIFETSTEEPFLPATEIVKRLGLDCSAGTVRNRLRQRGLRSRVPAKKGYLRREHVEKRLAFAYRHSQWPVSEWDRVVFSDEKIFHSSGYGPPRVWRPMRSDRYDEKYLNLSKHSSRFSIAVWACISGAGHYAIHLIQRRTLDQQYYIENILDPIVKDDLYARDPTILFAQDLSPIHTGRLTRQWILDNGIPTLDDWPPRGADLNPIENVWAEIERILKDREVFDRQHLWLLVAGTFEDLTAVRGDFFRTLIDSMPRRVASVIDRKGGWSKY